uniref:Uncharacterized protein n=1 Tax=Onchocerca volvulus TaxID=6282 RepID=A0A8R1TQJ2_ONCVO
MSEISFLLFIVRKLLEYPNNFSFVRYSTCITSSRDTNLGMEAIKRSMLSKSSTATANISDIRPYSVTISDVGEPLQVSFFLFFFKLVFQDMRQSSVALWDEILIVILLAVIALILFITGMYMVDRIQHGKDRLFRKYIDEQKRFREKKWEMKLILDQLTNSNSMTLTSIDS